MNIFDTSQCKTRKKNIVEYHEQKKNNMIAKRTTESKIQNDKLLYLDRVVILLVCYKHIHKNQK